MKIRHSAGDTRGFTLIEVMVGLAVFSIAILALLKVGSENAKALYAVESRTMAEIVAENQLIEALVMTRRLEGGETDGEVEMAGRTWLWRRAVEPMPQVAMVRVDISVSDPETGQMLTKLSGFRAEQ